jgi:predicted PurR-regulated permease PerM
MFARTTAALEHLWSHLQSTLPAFVTRLAEAGWSSLIGATHQAGAGGTRFGERAGKAAEALTSFASGVVFVPVFVFLMLRRFHHVTGGLARVVPPRWRESYLRWAREADTVLSGYIRGHLTVAFILACTYSAAFTILGIPLGIVVGIATGLGELVPFLGGLLAITLGSLMALAGGHPAKIFWVIGIYVFVQGIQSSVISPWIEGHKAKIGPAAVIISLAIGAQLFGLLGMVLAVPVTGLLKVAARAAVSAYRSSPFFRARAPA